MSGKDAERDEVVREALAEVFRQLVVSLRDQAALAAEQGRDDVAELVREVADRIEERERA